MKRRTLLTGMAAATATLSCKPTTRADVGGVVVDDVSRLNECRVRRVTSCATVDDVVAAVLRAKREGVQVIASGRRHSQGGQCSIDDGVVLDVTPLKKIIAIDEGPSDSALTITVQGGASWDDVQRALNPRGLAVRTMQSSNIFTVAGSLASNIHGRDVNDGVIFSSVRSLTLIDAEGKTRVLAAGDPLLPFVVGGYGLFGVVVEATLAVTRNTLMQHRTQIVRAVDVPALFTREIAGTDALFIARPSIAPSSFLDETIVETWTSTAAAIDDAALKLGEEANVQRDKLVFDASRRSAAGKEARWVLQRQVATSSMPTVVTRNNAMRPPTTPLLFLNHTAPGDTDIVQEYFVPAESYGGFLAAATKILLLEKVNVLGLTIRFVKGNDDAVLSFAPVDSFAFMIYSNMPRTNAGVLVAQRMTQRLVDAVVAAGGRHYLTYQTWATPEQLGKAWPRMAEFLAAKKAHDPGLLFQSRFYRACANT
ncbi:MAG: FAD-binding oxidoreductase [Deltaproteobacteria bacterium]|nr:FAD-binding oxidoreductase [Deltaproteobacteria bacterium]